MLDGIRAPRALWCCLACLLCMTLLGGCGSRSWRKGGVPGSQPYTVRGKTYYPLKSARGYVEEGIASWYGPGFHGKKTASGETYNQNALTAAHKILPLGTLVRVTHLGNARSATVKINDRGPFVDDRVIDLSNKAATSINMIGKGTARVRITALEGTGAKDIDEEAAAGAAAESAASDAVNQSCYIQAGAYTNKARATALSAALTRLGYSGRLLYNADKLWNVQAGPFTDADSANRVLKRIRLKYPRAFLIAE